ncbi:unnamed protein product, partial [Heterosigma akashiwo]
LLVYSPNDYGLHLKHLQDVFTKLKDANLRVKLSKCKFAFPEVSYLGYKVGREGLKVDPEKVLAITQLARPESKKDVRRFLGMCGFYRSMIPMFSVIAAPLHSLTKNSGAERVEWNQECEVSFNKLKKMLSTYPVLRFPDFSKTFVLETDASRTGIGAVLSQEYDGILLPVAYTSRLTTSAEKIYSIFD